MTDVNNLIYFNIYSVLMKMKKINYQIFVIKN